MSAEERKLMGRNNYQHIINHYSKDLIIRKIESVLKNIMGEVSE